jgi:hypothetical protein
MIFAGVGAGLGAIAIVAAVIMGVFFMRRTPVARPPSKSRTVVIIQEAAPATVTTNPMAANDRVGFEPVQRCRV